MTKQELKRFEELDHLIDYFGCSILTHDEWEEYCDLKAEKEGLWNLYILLPIPQEERLQLWKRKDKKQ